MLIIGGVHMDYQKTGLLIAGLRKEKGLTQKELADKLGVTDRAVSKWERGLGCPDISLLDDLSRILDISILEILKGRRLDKDEIANNESIIESMNYSKESFRHKLKGYFNFICISYYCNDRIDIDC
jgi:transcriptional regulator with XRE-family HTH domain